jgi:hypothetical protein
MAGLVFVTSLAVLALIFGCSCSAAQSLPKQVSNTAQCVNDGISDTSQYRRHIRVPGSSSFLPVYSSVDLTKPLQVDSLLIFVHGIRADANAFFCDAFKAVPASVGVIVPWFGDEQVQLSTWLGDAAAAASSLSKTTSSLYWKGSGWSDGAAAASDPSIASFAAMDAVIDHASKAGRLKQVVVAGFSAGGQMVQRYAWATAYNSGSSPPVKFVVSDPSSFLYFDSRRPEEACRPHKDTGSGWSCAKFCKYTTTSANCDAFNTYKLGLEGFSGASPYFSQQRFAASTDAVSAAYLQKNILYIFGGADACNCETKGFQNPESCIRPGASCSPSRGGGPTCCDMPGGRRINEFVAVSCGDMLQVRECIRRVPCVSFDVENSQWHRCNHE